MTTAHHHLTNPGCETTADAGDTVRTAAGWWTAGRDLVGASLRFVLVTGLVRGAALAWLALGTASAGPPPAAASDVLRRSAQAIEAQVDGFPGRAAEELAALIRTSDVTATHERTFVHALYGRSLVLAGRYTEALDLAARLEADARAEDSEPMAAAALLVRSAVESSTGDAARASMLARNARVLAQASPDTFLPFWAEMSLGVTSRIRGRLEESLESLQRALALAKQAESPFRTSSALYQLAIAYLDLKQPDRALEASLSAFREAEAAGSMFAMANARMAESAALEVLDDPQRELAAIQDALAIAHRAQSKTTESKALINLADIHLRRQDFEAALALSRRSLALARETDDVGLAATSRANLGFALFGLGRAREGKRHAEEAIAQYEASGATADTAALLAEYGRYLERSGDYRSAAAVYHRERKLTDEIALAAYQKTVLEMQRKYESERQTREIGLRSRENHLESAELAHRELERQIWWVVAFVLGASFVVVAVLYRKLRVINRLLAHRNVELSFQSSRDPLTALYNRRYFQDFIGDEGSTAERRRRVTGGAPIQALLLIDIDHFKEINDRYGHAAGDAVLVTVAHQLRETLRETDMIVRWGGEEFLVFVPATQVEELDDIAARIMETIVANPVSYHGKSIRVTASVGYAPMPLPPDGVALGWERAIGLVDMALYMAKVQGRNRACGILGLHRSDEATLAALERDLEGAWHDGIVDMRTLRGPAAPAPAGPGSAAATLH
jgi:diguanylate cyclase (GGDEF)-like protein